MLSMGVTNRAMTHLAAVPGRRTSLSVSRPPAVNAARRRAFFGGAFSGGIFRAGAPAVPGGRGAV